MFIKEGIKIYEESTVETEENTLVSKIKDWMMLHVTCVFRTPLPKVIHIQNMRPSSLRQVNLLPFQQDLSHSSLSLALFLVFPHSLCSVYCLCFFSSEYQMKFTPEIVNSLQGESLAHVNLTFVFKQTLGTCCTCLQCNTLCQ